jgi:hypothetical protein
MHDVLNWIILNRTIWSQTKACIAKSLGEICAVLGYCAA